MDFDTSFHLISISWPDAILRVALALLFGFCLGYDRVQKNKPVDFRVYMVVTATTCLLAIMGLELVGHYDHSDENVNIGLLRIVQGVLTGIGFLGAGAIIQPSDSDNRIIGSTTGASIWGSGAMGLMLGFGMYGLALLGFAMLAIVLIVFGKWKNKILDTNK